MDADTRHQLKQNELFEAMRNLRTVLEPPTVYWLLLIIVIVAAWGGYKIYKSTRESSLAAQWQGVITVESITADGVSDEALARLRDAVSDSKNPAVEAAARLRLGHALLARSYSDEAKREALGREAVEVLSPATDPTKTPAPFAAAAQFALGSAYETLRQFADARTAYETIADQPAFLDLPYTTLAAQRLDSLNDLESPIKFVAGEAPPPAPPATAPAPVQIRPTTRPAAIATQRATPAEQPAEPSEEPQTNEAAEPTTQPTAPPAGDGQP